MSWVRTNRTGLILLPVALVLAVVASSSRVVHFWWPYGPHRVTAGTVGAPVTFSQKWQDNTGHHTRTLTVTVHGIARTDVLRSGDDEDIPGHGPAGTALWRVSMTVDADPQQVLTGCQLEIIDTVGRSYLFGPMHLTPDFRMKTSPCVPPGREGPGAAVLGMKASTSEQPRPAHYATVADVILAGDAKPATVRLWWDYPQVIEVPIRSS